MHLLKIATQSGFHSYYHFLVGVEFPLKDQDYIHHFFHSHNGYEFIGFDRITQFEERVKLYHVFNEYGRYCDRVGKLKHIISKYMLIPQRRLHINCIRKTGWKLMKGNADWSITDKLARYVVSQEKVIDKYFKHSYLGDEVFVHTLVYNSKFYDWVYDQMDEWHSNMRIVQWDDPKNLYHFEDLPKLLQSEYLFARKFSGKEGLEMAEYIRNNRMQGFAEKKSLEQYKHEN